MAARSAVAVAADLTGDADLSALPTTVPELQALHAKMTKKLTQLTKVIVVLNTKNDETELERMSLIALHRRELSERDEVTAMKLTGMTVKLADIERDERRKYESALVELERRAASDRERLQQQFRAIQSSLESQHQQSLKSYNTQLIELKSQVETAKLLVTSKLHAFTKLTRELEIRHSAELKSEREARESEVSLLTTKTEERIKALMTDKLRLESELEKLRASRSEQKVREASEAKVLQEMELTKKNYEDKLKEQSKDIQDIENKMLHEMQINKALTAQLTDATSRMESLKLEHQDSLNCLRNEIESQRSQWLALDQQREQIMNRLQVDLSDARTIIDSERAVAEQQLTGIERLKADLVAKCQSLECDLSTQRVVTSELTVEIQSLREELSNANDTVKQQNLVIDKLQQSSSFSTEQQQSVIASLTEQLSSAKQQIKEMQEKGKILQEKNEKDSAESEVQQQQLQQSQQGLDRLTRQFEEYKQEVTDRELMRQSEIGAEAQERARDAEARIQREIEARQHLQSEFDQHRAQSELVINELSACARALEAELQESQTQLSAAQSNATDSSSQFTTLQSKFSELSDKHSALIEQHRQLQCQCESLHNALNDRVQLLSDQSNRLHEIEAEWQTKLCKEINLRESVECELSALKLSKSNGEDEAVRQSNSLQQKLTATQRLLIETQQALETLQAQFESERQRFQSSHSSIVDEWQRRLEQERHQQATAIREVARKGETDLAALRDRLTAERLESDREHDALLGTLGRRIDELQLSHEQQLSLVQQQLSETNQLLEKSKLSDLERQRDQERLRQQRESEFCAQMDGERQSHQQQLRQMETDWSIKCQSLTQSLSTLHSQLDVIAGERTQLEAELMRQTTTFDEQMTQQKQLQNRAQIERDAEYNRELSLLRQSHDAARRGWEAETVIISREWEAKEREWAEREAKLQARFDRREARREDVLRIRELEEYALKEKKRRRKAEEDAKIFQLELINREESYNKMFNRSPVVGNFVTGPALPYSRTSTSSNSHSGSHKSVAAATALKPPFLSSLAITSPSSTFSSPSQSQSPSVALKSHTSSPSTSSHPHSLPQVHSDRRWSRTSTESSSTSNGYDTEEKSQMGAVASLTHSRESSSNFTPRRRG